MAEQILNLRSDVRDTILNNQQKYNPNFNATIDDEEIGVLLSEFGGENIDELKANDDESDSDVDMLIKSSLQIRKNELDSTIKEGNMALNKCNRVLSKKAYPLRGFLGGTAATIVGLRLLTPEGGKIIKTCSVLASLMMGAGIAVWRLTDKKDCQDSLPYIQQKLAKLENERAAIDRYLSKE